MLPFYVSVFTYHLLINIWLVYVYTQDPTVLELQARSIFNRFPNQWVELIYNTLYRRAVFSAFVTTYKLLQLIKATNRTPTGFRAKLLLLLVRLVCISLFQVPWQIVSRSYHYTMAFSYVYSYRNFRINIIRTRIINNYQLGDLHPGLYLRVYKDDKSEWNFNLDFSK